MKQQINLLNPALLKAKLWLNVTTLAVAASVLVGLMLFYNAYASQQNLVLNTQRLQATTALSAMQAQLTKIALLHQPRSVDQTLMNKIMQLEHQEIMQQKILHVVKQSSASADKSYAGIMLALARQSLEGLWLRGFSIDSHSEAIRINGRSLDAALVPEYIMRLGTEPALHGKSFAAFNMHTAQIAATAPGQPAASTMASSAANTAAPAQPLPPIYLEFILNAIDESTTSSSRDNVSPKGGQP